MGVAYADESMRTLNSESMYLLGATLFDNAGQGLDDLVRLKARGAAKLHWRELGRKTQMDVMRAISNIPALTTVVVGTPMNPHKQERARRKCLEAMVGILVEQGVKELVLEARDSSLDKRDIQLVDTIKSKHHGLAFAIHHRKGSEDPRLWIPDQVLGAYGDQLCLTELDDDWLCAWHSLEPRTKFVAIDL